MRTIFLDCDGVLADFDAHYLACFGIRPDKSKPDPPDFWKLLDAEPTFYADLPRMPDAAELVGGVTALGFTPTILTGVPASIGTAAAQKRAWRDKHFPALELITCFSRNKFKYMQPGDVLIDDWERHKDAWVEHGGLWITHTSAAESVRQLTELIA